MNLKSLNKKLIAGGLLAMCTFSASALELSIQSPTRAASKPDLIIYSINQNYYAGGDIIRVTIRNIGNATSDSAVLAAQNLAAGGGYGEASIPSIAPGSIKNVDIKLSKPPQSGDRIKFFADAKYHVSESNEGNNVQYINY